MAGKYLIALDQGTTSSRAVVFDLMGNILASRSIEFRQIYPEPGWVEHSPEDILESQTEALRSAVKLAGIPIEEIIAVGITNQRETTLLWDKRTGECVYNAIVWQCRRTAPYIQKLKEAGHEALIKKKTGLIPDAYFSGTKLAWLLDHLDLRDRAHNGELCFGTVDSYLAWHMVTGRPHVTDATNASRTMLFNLHTQQWDEDLLNILNIPKELLPQVIDSAGFIGMLDSNILGRPIPVAAMAGDQHASLFGQACFEPGSIKNTYGTGCFMLMNTGNKIINSHQGLLSTMAWRIKKQPVYALEGSVFMAGAIIQWLRDELNILNSAAESESIAREIKDTGGVYMVPAFTGLGAPWWDMYSRGMMIGMTRGTGRAHIIRAALEAIAYQSYDLVHAMAKDWGTMPISMQVDGGASANGFLMQFQSDIMAMPIIRPSILETTALGAAMMAGLAMGAYPSMQDIKAVWQKDLEFRPSMDAAQREGYIHGWHRAVERSLGWIEP